MCFDSGVAEDEGHVRGCFALQHPQKIARELRLGHLHADRQHPDLVEGELTVVAAENVQLALDNVGRVPAAGARFELGCGHLFPVIGLDVENMDVVPPMHAVVTSEVDNLAVDEAAGGRDAGTGLVTAHQRLYPRQRLRIQVEDVVQLSKLVRLASKYVDLLVKRNCGMLQAANWRDALCLNRAAPLKSDQVKDKQVVEPGLAVASAEHEHIIFDDRRRVKLAHRGLATNNGRYVESKFVYTLLEVDENDVGKHLEAVPTAVDDDLGAIPYLAAVAHARLRQLVFVYLWLEPGVLFCVEDENVVHDAFLAVAFPAAEN